MSPFIIHKCDNINFPSRTVEAIIDYAYTGSIAISVENAEQIYLLAHKLECEDLKATCVEVLIPR